MTTTTTKTVNGTTNNKEAFQSICDICDSYQSALEDSGISSNEQLQESAAQDKLKLTRILSQITRVKSFLLQTKRSEDSVVRAQLIEEPEHQYDRFTSPDIKSSSTECTEMTTTGKCRRKVKRRHTRLYYDSLRGHRSLPAFEYSNTKRSAQHHSKSRERNSCHQFNNHEHGENNNKYMSWTVGNYQQPSFFYQQQFNSMYQPPRVLNNMKQSNIVRMRTGNGKPIRKIQIRCIKFNGPSDFIFCH
ncbi:hypothetical protein ACOME3_007961 [Neoechinorhynchus agilis]